MTQRHAIIAGANKCGTTSLFRYLAAHPDVRASRVKETEFFLRTASEAPDALEAWLGYFAPLDARDEVVLLEATPHYLEFGRTVARRIHRLLPEARLMFLLRDPVERFQSFYRSKQGFEDFEVSRMNAGDYIDRAFAEAAAIDDDASGAELRDAPLGRQLVKGRYAIYLRSFLEVFPPSALRVLYFEDLRDRPAQVVTEACEFLGLDPGMYREFEFAVENRSRRHRHSGLRTLASRANHRLEPMLNRVPWLRRAARSAYNAVNTESPGAEASFSRSDGERLADYFAPFDRQLAALVAETVIAGGAPPWTRHGA